MTIDGAFEYIYQPLFDVAHYPAAGTYELNWFMIPRGGMATLLPSSAGPGVTLNKWLHHTNVLHPSLVYMKEFEFRSLRLTPHREGDDLLALSGRVELTRLLRSGAFRFYIASKIFLELPLHTLAPDILEYEALRLRGRPEFTVWEPYRYRLDPPISIPMNVPFSAGAVWAGGPPLSLGFDLGLLLDGVMRRPLQ